MRWGPRPIVPLEEIRQQRDEALAHVIVRQQDFNKKIEEMKGLALNVETSQLQQQKLWEVITLEGRCASLLEDAKTAKDRVNQAYEERVQKFKSYDELKKNIYEEAFCMFAMGYN